MGILIISSVIPASITLHLWDRIHEIPVSCSHLPLSESLNLKNLGHPILNRASVHGVRREILT